jgi:ParB family chromosome partitioning protein
MAVKRSLGRGLNELLSRTQPIKNSAPTEEQQHLPVVALKPGKYQPRKDMHPEALQELAASIRAQGILQPILVRPLPDNHYEIIAGERRWRAAQLAELDKVPVFVRNISDEMAMAMGLIENIQREDLNPVEQAVALQRLVDEFQLTHEEIAKAVGKSRVSISNFLRLLNLDPRVITMLEKSQLDMGHARALLSLNSNQQFEIAKQVIAKDLSVRVTEELVRTILQPAPAKPKSTKPDTDVLRLQSELSDKIGATVKIQHSSKGKGKLVIHYHNLDQLDGILERIS